MKILTLAFATTVLAFSLSGTANATVSVSATQGGPVYAGPTPLTYDFDSTTPTTSAPGNIVTGTVPDQYAQPLGSEGNYFSSGPSTTDPSVIFLNGLGDIFNISLLWGSIDSYNTLTFTDAVGNPLGADYTFSGDAIAGMVPAAADGSQVLAAQNPIVTFTFSGGDESLVRGIRLFSNGTNAFEIDDIAVNAVPEPGTWAMMLLGFGAIGLGLRRRRSAHALPQIA